MKKFFVMTVCCLVAAMCAFSLVACSDKPHEHSGGTANCTDKAVCEVCGEEYGETNLSVHKSDEFTYSVNASDPSKHDKKHKCCGALVETVAHSGGTATLDSKAKCEFCDAEYGEKLQPSLTVDKTTATVTLGDTLTLTATPVGISGALEWSSNNESVATVSDGVITAIKEGTANITVSGGGKSATCAVTVGLGGFVPALNFINPVSDTVELTMLETVDLGANVSFNGKTYSDAKIDYDISPAGVVKVEGGVLKPVAAGDATVTVTATWRNVTAATLSKTLTVNVSNAVELKVNGNAVPDKITLYTIDELNGTNYDTSCDFNVTLKVNGESKTPTVTPADTTKVTYSGNTLTAGAYGNTTVRITYSDTTLGITVDETVDIEVIRPVATYANKIEWFSAYDGDISVLSGLFGADTITSAKQTLDDVDSDIVVNDEKNNISGVKTKRDQKTVTTFTVCTETYGWKFNVEAYTKVIADVSDFEALNLSADKTTIDGYFVLKNDILDMRATRNTANITQVNARSGFIGVFDGLGHTIDEYWVNSAADKTHSYGFFFSIGPNAVIKNVSFTNLAVKGNDTMISMILSWYVNTDPTKPARIENVYMDVNIEQERTKFLWVLGRDRTPYMNVDNLVVKINTPAASATGNNTQGIGLFGRDMNPNTINANFIQGNEIKNTYIISSPNDNGRVFPLIQNAGDKMAIYAINDFETLNHGDKIDFNTDLNPVANAEGAYTLYRFKNVKRYNTFADLMDESKGNVQKVGNWKITADGPVWEA